MLIHISLLLLACEVVGSPSAISIEAPPNVGRYDVAEFVIRSDGPAPTNPFTDVEVTGTFTGPEGKDALVRGFVDSQDGRMLRLRFCPDRAPATYDYTINVAWPGTKQQLTGMLRSEPSDRPGPVVVDPEHPRHFIRAGSREPFFHSGCTAYHLLDPGHTDAQIDELVDYCVNEGFNKIRFLLVGYPRDSGGQPAETQGEYGVPDPWRAANYGAPPGSISPLPAWLGEPHHYDFARFNVAYWQRVDRAVRKMREAGIVATCIVTIEKQGLPREYGSLTEAEYRLYRYAIARLAAFDNVWWDLGNEHNEYRKEQWAETMGRFVKQEDPYDRLVSVHGYADFLYAESDWADFIITQQYGEEREVHDWVGKYAKVPKPYVNEEYGYEGEGVRNQKGKPNAPGHGQSSDWVRRCAWSMAMAGGYSTYGDWSRGTSWFYMGRPGPGRAARQLKHLRRFFEPLPFSRMTPRDELTSQGFCLALPPQYYVFYLPRGGEASIDLSEAGEARLASRWFNPRTGQSQQGSSLPGGKSTVTAPNGDDWALLVEGDAAATAATTPSPAWTSANRYRILLSVNGRAVARSCSPACVGVDFSQTMRDLHATGSLDEDGIEVVGYDASGAPVVYDRSASGAERFLLPWRLDQYYGISHMTLSFVMPTHECTRYAVYFDTKEAGRTPTRRFPGLVGDGDWFCLGYGAREIAASKMDAFCDFDNDGDLDLFKVTVEPFIYCYENVGGNRYVDRGRMTSDGKVFLLPSDRNNRSWAALVFDDWDGDGDQDLFAGLTTGDEDYRDQFVAYENTSAKASSPRFTERGTLKTPSGETLGSQWFATLKISDLDGDGRKDILVTRRAEPQPGRLNEFHRIMFHRNNGGAPWAFNLADGVALQAGGQEIQLHSPKLECADTDSDGDLDLFTAEQNGRITRFENTGSATKPAFAAGQAVGTSGGHAGITVADFTGDGLLDYCIGDLWGSGPDPGKRLLHARLSKNVGSRTQPRFEDVGAEGGAPRIEGFLRCDMGRQNFVRVADWDEDGAADLMAGSENGNVYWLRNEGNARRPLFAAARQLLSEVGPAARPEICDWNEDGRKDLLVANVQGNVRLFLNEGTKGSPQLGPGRLLEANGKAIDGTHWGSVLVCDWDEDGHKDLILGMGGEGNPSASYDWPHLSASPANDRGFLFYRNTGTNAAPILGGPEWIRAGGKLISYTRPNVGSFADWDGDGLNDFVACEFESIVWLHRNVGPGGAGKPPVFTSAQGTAILKPWTVQMVSGAHVIDWNGDGDLDIVTGQGHGGTGLRFFERDYLDDELRGTHPRVTISGAERKTN